MEDRDYNSLKKAFPPEYVHVAEFAYEAQRFMTQIDAEIDRLKRTSGPVGPVPEGGPGATTKEARIAEHSKQRARIAMDTWDSMEQELIEADPEKAKIVRENVRFMLDTQNKQLGKDDKTLEAQGNTYQKQTQKEAKHRDKNFDYATTRYFERKTYRLVPKENTSNNLPTAKNVVTQKEVKERPSFSSLFSRSLNYTINLEKEKANSDRNIQKSAKLLIDDVKNNPKNTLHDKDIAEEKEVPVKQSFAELYSKSLTYTINTSLIGLNIGKDVEKPFEPSKD